TCYRVMPFGGVFNQVIGMNRRLPTRSQGLFPGEPCKLHPLPVYPNVAAVGLRGKRYRWYRLNDVPELYLAATQRILSPLAPASIACLAQGPLHRRHEPR